MISMVVHTVHLFMILAYVFQAFRKGHWYYIFGYAQLDKHKWSGIAPLPTSILADLDAGGQYTVNHRFHVNLA